MLKVAGLTFISKLMSAALNFGLIILVSNLLGLEERGKCAFYLIIIVVILGISEIAGGSTTAFLMQRFSGRDIATLHARWTLIPIILVPIGFYLFKTVSWIEMLLIVAGGWFHCRWNMLQHIVLGLQYFKRFNVSIVLAPLLTMVFFGIFWLMDFSSKLSYLVSLVLSWGILYFSSSFFLNKRFLAINSDEKAIPSLKDIILPGILNQSAHLASLINNRLIFFILPAIQLGLWSNALSVAESLLMVPGSLGQIMYAQIAAKKSGDNPLPAFRKVLLYNTFFMLAGLSVLLILPDGFWSMVFGKEFSGLKQLIVILLPGLGLYSFYLIITYWHSASGKFLFNLIPLLIGLILSLGGTIFHLLKADYSLEKGIWLLSVSWVFCCFSASVLLLWSYFKRKGGAGEI